MVLLLSTYELGRQPFGLASPAAWLRRAGVEVRAADLSRDRLSTLPVERATLVAFYLPMHTATRLAIPVIDRVREMNPAARLCAYGLYAPLSADILRAHGVETILGPEFEADLTALALRGLSPASQGAGPVVPQFVHGPECGTIPRLAFIPPDRGGLPALDRYAALQMPDGTRRTAGYTEASRGCKHLCRHCPVVPVYGGRFRVVARNVVLDDIAAQVDRGAAHVTFGDPDFFNGPTHARLLVESLAAKFPGLSYDVTVKVEHLLTHAVLLPVLRDTGCLFVTSAVEAVDDDILACLAKGHTRADVERVADLMRDLDLPLVPTFVAFTPWTTVEGYVDLLKTIERLGWIESVAPIQLAIRLLLPAGSRLFDLPDVRALAGPLDVEALAHPWRHADPRVDALQREVQRAVGRRLHASRRDTFDAVCDIAAAVAGHATVGRDQPRLSRAAVPYLTEPWYC
jgi:radical SAM superfamily enzyme YgiQ (UPF0313 family)